LYGFSSIRPIPRDVPRAANLTPRAGGIKALPFNLPREVFNSFVEKFVEKGDQKRVHREKHWA
jgi:hypothetical protein